MRALVFFVVLAALGCARTDDNSMEDIKISLIPGYGYMLYNDVTGNMNDYLDRVLKEAKENFAKFNIDPMAIPNFEHNVQHKVWFVTLNGGVKVTNGVAKGLSTLHRSGDATLQMNDGTNVMHLDGSLGASNIHISANVYAWYSFLKINVQLTGTASYVSASVELELPMSGDGFKPKATRFTVDRMDSFKLKITGLGPLNWLAEKIISWYTGDIRKFVNEKFAGMALNAINSKIGDVIKPNLFP